MRIWPVLLDSQPLYLGGRGASGSLLLAPVGAETVFRYVSEALSLVTDRAPLVLLRESDNGEYHSRILAECPAAKAVATTGALADAVSACELSDALLIVDPRCLPLHRDEFVSFAQSYLSEYRVAHHLVALENGIAGTKERVSFDSTGHVRRIHRHYVPVTWPFMTGVAATLLPVGSGILADGCIPSSLAELRQRLVVSDVPSRDVPIQRGSLDLSDEMGLLAANEHFVHMAFRASSTGFAPSTPLLVGNGQIIHATARLTGPVILHRDTHIAENAIVFGPAVIAAGARIGPGAVVAQSIVGPTCTVPAGKVVRTGVWCDEMPGETNADREPLAYSERFAQIVAELRTHEAVIDKGAMRVRIVDRFLKRALDVVVAAFALVVLSPLFLLIAATVWLECRRPILYGDEREGLGGRLFRCWKFRTMLMGAHAVQSDLKTLDKMDGPHFKLDDDPRVTRVGGVLRALNLDELPQLFNVLTGEMSLVGPRPSPFRENQVCVPWREARLSVQPGITGFWQVCRHDRADGDFHQWIEYDLLYVQHMSFWLDLKILVATLFTLGGKARHIPSSWLVPSASGRRDIGPRSIDTTKPTASKEQVA